MAGQRTSVSDAGPDQLGVRCRLGGAADGAGAVRYGKPAASWAHPQSHQNMALKAAAQAAGSRHTQGPRVATRPEPCRSPAGVHQGAEPGRRAQTSVLASSILDPRSSALEPIKAKKLFTTQSLISPSKLAS